MAVSFGSGSRWHEVPWHARMLAWVLFPMLAMALPAALAGTRESAHEDAAVAVPGKAADMVLHRLLGARADDFNLVQDAGGVKPWYRVEAGSARVVVHGSSQLALARGAYAYLNQAGLASVSWEGRRIEVPKRWPGWASGTVVSPFRFRAYLNTCTYGYTTPFWGWSDWEQEIDWMALHGIDMPLAMEGQEAIWQRLWREFGLSEAEISAYFSGPAFAPWQRMGNIQGYQAPLPQAWIDKKADLQHRILARMHELGMTPVLPAFAGYVPEAFAKAHPEARIYRMRAWEGFHETYWLDPTDPLFAKIAQRFISLYAHEYGPGHYYLADAFNEMLPPVAADGSDVASANYGDSTANTEGARARAVPAAQRDARLAQYGDAIYRSIAHAAPDATWVMQGWLFGADRAFWQPQAIAAFLSKVPDDRMLVLDIGNDRYPGIWKASQAFDGKQWVYGYVHNYGGSNPVYGDFDFYRRDIAATLADSQRGELSGFGVFPEGLHNNSVVYEYLFDQAWGGLGQSWEEWIAQYSRARYGRSDPRLLAAWEDLRAAVYTTRYWTPRWWEQRAGAYLLFKRPTQQVTAYDGSPGDPVRLRKAIDELLALWPEYRDSALFQHDLVDDVRHYLGLRTDALLRQAVSFYQHGDYAAGDAARDKLEELVRGVDRLVGTQQDSLSTWTAQARDYADGDPALARYYVANARTQVSVWGGRGNLADYASKAWQGMYAGFYLQRWIKFLEAYRSAQQAGVRFDQAAFTDEITAWEWRWAGTDAVPPPQAPSPDTHALITRLLHRESLP